MAETHPPGETLSRITALQAYSNQNQSLVTGHVDHSKATARRVHVISEKMLIVYLRRGSKSPTTSSSPVSAISHCFTIFRFRRTTPELSKYVAVVKHL